MSLIKSTYQLLGFKIVVYLRTYLEINICPVPNSIQTIIILWDF